jgi:uncharacterized protein (DUF2236 family)
VTTGSASFTSGCPVAPGGYDAPPEPLGPGSLTWKYFGDWRGMLQGPWAGSMQAMHPHIGAALDQHSTFRIEPWARVLRSLYPIGGVVFDTDRAPRTGAEVRAYHNGIKGVDEKGRRYHALDPDAFYWAHTTFFMGTILVAEHFCGGITEDEKRQLFDEHVAWYRMYGMSMRPVPETWEDFQEYWDHMCRNVLEDNRATRDVLDLENYGKPWFLSRMPDILYEPIQRRTIAPLTRWLCVGMYGQPVRELLGFSWSGRDEWLHRRLCGVVRIMFSLLPKRARKHPRARAGLDRATGRIPADTPLPETPAHNLPPLDRRGQPMHYCPEV